MSGTIRVNGATWPLDTVTVAELVEKFGVKIGARGVAVALNGSVVPRNAWRSTPLKDGDDVEVIRAMSGG
jgi:sulfur carrier protein